ncbi:hypothetical protein CHL67_05880 [Prosthecochloris sp. GSB1]|nr:hypothetical protein CHL67_05880 [Prosthecochloris sp. GSB1]
MNIKKRWKEKRIFHLQIERDAKKRIFVDYGNQTVALAMAELIRKLADTPLALIFIGAGGAVHGQTYR